MSDPLPDYLLTRADSSADEIFYAEPRYVTHIDDETIAAITEYYRGALAPDSEILDLMSSWISHLPEEVSYRRVAGLGMNAEELAANPRLDDWLVHNLNETPDLPYPPMSFDAVMIVVSIQYLARPMEVFEQIAEVLKPGGRCIVVMSHRLFPTKAIYAFQALGPNDRFNLVRHYMTSAGLIDIQFEDRSPDSADPCWILCGNKPIEE